MGSGLEIEKMQRTREKERKKVIEGKKEEVSGKERGKER